MLVNTEFLKTILKAFRKSTTDDIHSALEASQVESSNSDIPVITLTGTIPVNKTAQVCELIYKSQTHTFHAYVKIKAQGALSMSFPKKNLSIELFADKATLIPLNQKFKHWGLHNTYVLKANYIDHLHARNIVGANLWADIVKNRKDFNTLPEELKKAPNAGAMDGFPVKVYANGEYVGLYTWNIPQKAWAYGMDTKNPNHIVLQANANDNGMEESRYNPCNFNKPWSGVNGQGFEIEVGHSSEQLTNSFNKIYNNINEIVNYTPINFSTEFTCSHHGYIASDGAPIYDIDSPIEFNQMISPNTTYIVTFNGTPYECKSFGDEYVCTLGNVSKLWGDYPTENENINAPFCIKLFMEDDEIEIFTTEVASLYSLSIVNKDTLEVLYSNLENVIDLQSVIDYFIFQQVINGIDGFANNMVLTTYDLNKWYLNAYDLDATFDLFYDGTLIDDPYLNLPADSLNVYSDLWKLLNLDNYKKIVYNRYKELRKTQLSDANILAKFEHFLTLANEDIRIQDTIAYPDIPSITTNNFNYLKYFIYARLKYLDNRMEI